MTKGILADYSNASFERVDVTFKGLLKTAPDVAVAFTQR
jgi:hypothetical protein